MMTNIIKYFAWILLISTSSFAQEFECIFPDATKIKPVVKCEIMVTQSGFEYSYTLISLSESIQDIDLFMVDYFSQDAESFSPDGWGVGKIEGRRTFNWGPRFPEYYLKPKSLIKGFFIKSKGLPTITSYYSAGHIELPVFPESVEPEQCIGDNAFENSIKGKTIAPMDPPAVFNPLEFLTYIISLKHQSYELDWITNKGVENSLDTKLENARKKLEQGDIIAARNILNALINEVEAQGCRTYDDCPSGKHLTPEAYALLYYNTKYLIDNLKQTE